MMYDNETNKANTLCTVLVVSVYNDLSVDFIVAGLKIIILPCRSS